MKLPHISVDVEAQDARAPSKSTKKCFRYVGCACCCSCCFASAIAITVVIVRSAHTDVEINKISFKDVVFPGLFSNEPIKLIFTADVDVHNPNPIRVNVEPATFYLKFKGQILGNVLLEWGQIAAMKKSTLSARIVVDQLDFELSSAIIQDVLANDGRLQLETDGAVTAKVLFFRLTTQIACESSSPVVNFVTGSKEGEEEKCAVSFN